MALTPNLPPGTPNTVNPAVTPTWAFTPPSASVTATVRLYNTGRTPVYVGGSQVTQNNGLLIPPGSRPVEMQNVTQTLYALSPVVAGSAVAAGTMSASAVTVGTTAITLTATVPTSLAAGTTIIVGSTVGTGWEAQVVNSTTASSQITFANPLVQDHVGSGVIYTATAQLGQIGVAGGVV
jgi:hypothetical protein